MATALFSFVNYFDLLSASLSASSTATPGNLTVGNLQDPHLRRIWRSGSTTATLTADWGSTTAAVGVGVLAVAQPPDPGLFVQDYQDGRGHYNGWMAPTDTIRHRLSTSSPTDGDLYDSTALAGGWTAGYGLSVNVLPTAVSPRYWRADLVASTPDYIDLGRMWAGPILSVLNDVGYNWSDQWDDGAIVTSVPRSGAEFVDLGMRRRVLDLSLPALTESEAKGTFKELTRIAGIGGQVMCIISPSDATYAPTQAIIGRIKQVNPITQSNPAFYSTSFTITQTL